MITPSPPNDEGHARRLLVTLVVTTAAAALTAGVVLHKHPPAEAAVQRAEASPAPAVAVPVTPATSRRVAWRDPWKRPATMAGSASPSINAVPANGVMRVDPSLPSAAAAVEQASGFPAESTPTF